MDLSGYAKFNEIEFNAGEKFGKSRSNIEQIKDLLENANRNSYSFSF